MRARRSGFSIIELMIGLAIGALVLLGLAAGAARVLRGENVSAAKLDNELRNAAFVVERELRRAGYWGGALAGLATGPAAYSNPFSAIDTATAGCVLFTYDANGNGKLDTASPDERYGFMLSGGTLYMRTGGANFSCGAGSPDWQPLTDASLVRVSSFSVTRADTPVPIPRSSQSVIVRQLTVTLGGALVKDSSVSQSVTTTIRVRNDVLG